MNIFGPRRVNAAVLSLLALLLISVSLSIASADSSQDFDDALKHSTANVSPREPLKSESMDLWSFKKVRPFILLTHTGTIYPKKAFILIRKKDKGDPSKLRAAISKRLKTESFGEAEIIPIEEFFPDILEKHPEHKARIQRELLQTMAWFEKDKIKAVAVRLGENEKTEAIYRQ